MLLILTVYKQNNSHCLNNSTFHEEVIAIVRFNLSPAS